MEEAVIEAGKFVGAGFMFGLAAIGAGVGGRSFKLKINRVYSKTARIRGSVKTNILFGHWTS